MTVQSLCRVKKIVMTSNVLPLHFAPSQASSSQNSNVDSYLQYCEVDSLKPSKSESSLIKLGFESNLYFSFQDQKKVFQLHSSFHPRLLRLLSSNEDTKNII